MTTASPPAGPAESVYPTSSSRTRRCWTSRLHLLGYRRGLCAWDSLQRPSPSSAGPEPAGASVAHTSGIRTGGYYRQTPKLGCRGDLDVDSHAAGQTSKARCLAGRARVDVQRELREAVMERRVPQGRWPIRSRRSASRVAASATVEMEPDNGAVPSTSSYRTEQLPNTSDGCSEARSLDVRYAAPRIPGAMSETGKKQGFRAQQPRPTQRRSSIRPVVCSSEDRVRPLLVRERTDAQRFLQSGSFRPQHAHPVGGRFRDRFVAIAVHQRAIDRSRRRSRSRSRCSLGTPVPAPSAPPAAG